MRQNFYFLSVLLIYLNIKYIVTQSNESNSEENSKIKLKIL